MNRGLHDLEPYRVSAGATRPGADVLRLDWNEAQLPPSPMVDDAIRAGLGRLNEYPDVEATALREAIGAYTGVPAKAVRAYNGSDAALRDICMAFLSPDDAVLVRRPVYTQIDTFLAAANAETVDWHGETAFEHDVPRHMRRLAAHKPALAYLVNPNNPTGEVYTAGEIVLLAGAFPETVFVVDEAYVEFGATSCAPRVRDHRNLLVVRTFSKAFGLAGLRLGYVVGHPAALATLDLVRNGKEVNALAQAAGVATLADLGYVRAYVREVQAARSQTAAALRAMGLAVREAPANFLLVQVEDVTGLVAGLRAQGVLVRDRSYLPQMAGWVRVTVGTKAQMGRFVDAIRQTMEEGTR